MDISTKITITFPTNAYFMSGIRDFTLTMIQNMTKFSERWAYRFQSVVDELCNNAIEHGSTQGQEVKVTFYSEPGKFLEITVEDTGTGKNKMTASQLQNLIAERSQPGYAFTALRGRGLPKIVEEWSDEMEFSDRPEGGLKVRVRKILKKEDERSLALTLNDPTQVVIS